MHKTMRFAVSIAEVATFSATEVATAGDPGETTVKSLCVQCRSDRGQACAAQDEESDGFYLGGNKYRQAWLVAWLQKPEFKHYLVGCDFRPERKKPHLALPADKAKAVAAFLPSRAWSDRQGRQ